MGEGPSHNRLTDSLYRFDIVQVDPGHRSGGETSTPALGRMASAIGIADAHQGRFEPKAAL
ncbi:MAG: hypothetical protein DIU65_11535 [Proteobacteria bacterium]|nr:MAG: hypothetical protein DIU65_11535 [Pseudomonadota bacterium]